MNETVVWDLDRARRVLTALSLLIECFAFDGEDEPQPDVWIDAARAVAALREGDLDLPDHHDIPR